VTVVDAEPSVRNYSGFPNSTRLLLSFDDGRFPPGGKAPTAIYET
jgi:hypothetical protein